MINIEEEGEKSKLKTNNVENVLICPHCNCKFTFLEENVEVVIKAIPYKNRLKNWFCSHKYITYKYITCPWCKTKHKLKYSIDN